MTVCSCFWQRSTDWHLDSSGAVVDDVAWFCGHYEFESGPREQPAMHYRYTIIYVADVGNTLEFYRAAFGFAILFRHESGDYGELATGGTKLCFSSHGLMQQIGKEVATTPPEKPSYELAFETGDVAAGLERALAAGAVLVSGLATMPWGQTLAYVRAPEGTLIEICTPVKA